MVPTSEIVDTKEERRMLRTHLAQVISSQAQRSRGLDALMETRDAADAAPLNNLEE